MADSKAKKLKLLRKFGVFYDCKERICPQCNKKFRRHGRAIFCIDCAIKRRRKSK